MSNAARIAVLNDEFRKKGIGNGRLMLTRSIAEIGGNFQLEVLKRVREFNEFSNDNDPHNEHDFGSFDVDGENVFFKFDYYDLTLQAGSEDPSDPKQTCRVLTVMLAADY